MPRTEVKYGEPLFYLDTHIFIPSGWKEESDASLREEYKKAIMWATGLLTNKYVTEDGYMRSAQYGESMPDLPTVIGVLDLDLNRTSLKKIVEMDPYARIYVQYDESFDSIGVESGRGLYISALKQRFDSSGKGQYELALRRALEKNK